MENPEDTFVRVKISGMHFYSFYMPPSKSQEDFERMLARLVDDVKNRDFNAWAVEWGSKEINKRRQALLEVFSLMDLTLLNNGKKPTFVRGEASSMIDFTFVSSGLAKGNNC